MDRSFTFKPSDVIQPVPDDVDLPLDWEKQFSRASGTLLRLGDDLEVVILLDDRLTESNDQEVRAVFANEGIGGRILSCEKNKWEIRLEPIGENEFGLSIYTEKGKVLIAGHGRFDQSGDWSATFSSLYPRIRNRKRVTVSGSVGVTGGTGRRTTWQLVGSVSF